MPYARPDLDTLVSQALADIKAEMAGSDPLLQQSVLNIVATVIGEGFNSQYGYQDWISRQAVPATATDENFAAWAALKGMTQKPATAATGSFQFVAPADGLTIPADSTVTRSDGFTYATTSDAVSAGGHVTAPVVAATPGSAGNITAGVGGVLAAPIAGVTSAGVGIAGAAGADLEAFDDFKARVLQQYAAPPQGGDATDYVEWAELVSGVTRAWCRPHGMGAGTVVVYFMMDDAEAAFGGFPQGTNGVASLETRDTAATGDQLAVADTIFALQPVTALVYVYAPRPNTVTLTINLPGASADTKAAIATAFARVTASKGSPGGAILPGGLAGGVLNLSDIEQAIAAVANSAGFVITAVACDHGSVTPVDGNITANTGYLSVAGAITWTG